MYHLTRTIDQYELSINEFCGTFETEADAEDAISSLMLEDVQKQIAKAIASKIEAEYKKSCGEFFRAEYGDEFNIVPDIADQAEEHRLRIADETAYLYEGYELTGKEMDTDLTAVIAYSKYVITEVVVGEIVIS